MNASMADLDARTMRHIDNIGVIADYWIEHGIMDKFGVGFLGWAVGLIIPDLEKLELKDAPALARHLMEVLESRGLMKFRGKLRHIPARQYRTMVKIAGK